MQITIVPTKSSFYCTCGASIKFTGGSPAAIKHAVALWRQQHQDEGCAPCTAQKAAAARRRAERIASAQLDRRLS